MDAQNSLLWLGFVVHDDGEAHGDDDDDGGGVTRHDGAGVGLLECASVGVAGDAEGDDDAAAAV
jgi:hypothetical protein